MTETAWVALGVALIAAIPGTIAAWKGHKMDKELKTVQGKLETVHLVVNSRITQLLDFARSEALARGELKGREEAEARHRKELQGNQPS